MSNQFANNTMKPRFIITARPVCFVREVTLLTPRIDISRVRTDEFYMPVYTAISDGDIRLADEYISELQAQGVDKFAESVQWAFEALVDFGFGGLGPEILEGLIELCREFAVKLRCPDKRSHNDWPGAQDKSTAALSCDGKNNVMNKIEQYRLIVSMLTEIGGQSPGIRVSQKQLAAITAAADSVCAAFNEPDMCDNCSDKLRGGCLPTCTAYGKGNGNA
ncbi:hypothetical protein [Morganella morganii]|uniref:hypothetical protein n=1 Tax=Morganella morganii TaxID=582 RepID=UPI0033164510